VGDHVVTLTAIFGEDANPMNDTLEVITTHIGAPQPELGGISDTLETALPRMLDAGGDFHTYLWNGIPGNRTFNAESYGWVTLEVTNAAGCPGADSIYLMQSTGFRSALLQGELTVYPVPAAQYLYIEYQGEQEQDLYLSLFDSSGRKIMQKEFRHKKEIHETLELTGLAKGVYHLRLYSEGGQLTRRIAIH